MGALPPGPRTKVFLLGLCAAPQLRGSAGLGCTAPGTAYKGISFRVVRGPAGRRPREFRVHGPRDLVQRYFF